MTASCDRVTPSAMANKETGIPQRCKLRLSSIYDCVIVLFSFLPVNDRPDDKYLNKYVRGKVCAAGTNKWRDLGIVLMGQDDVYVLDIIKANSTDNVECCSRTFTEWRQRTPKASWKQLIGALKEVELTQLASELEELLIPSVECQKSKSSQLQYSLHQLEGINIMVVCVVCRELVIGLMLLRRRNLEKALHWPAYAWFLEIALIRNVC